MFYGNESVNRAGGVGRVTDVPAVSGGDVFLASRCRQSATHRRKYADVRRSQLAAKRNQIRGRTTDVFGHTPLPISSPCSPQHPFNSPAFYTESRHRPASSRSSARVSGRESWASDAASRRSELSAPCRPGKDDLSLFSLRIG
ncbi:hypothetical protein Bbelb_438350 [Branchiostoma belcheri]|nr:hypothetical protein Bbelb_444360 [Branchiostoma belcheri]KAI8478421.1 hypothetical protein Bbelb_438350 [Branchiostoma belcheri]